MMHILQTKLAFTNDSLAAGLHFTVSQLSMLIFFKFYRQCCSVTQSTLYYSQLATTVPYFSAAYNSETYINFFN